MSFQQGSPSDGSAQPLLNNSKAEMQWKQLADPENHKDWEDLGFSDEAEGSECHPLQEPALDEFEKLAEVHEALREALRRGSDTGNRALYDEKVERLKELMHMWDQISPQKFVVTVRILGKDSKDYLKLLSFEMREEDWPVSDGPGRWSWLEAARLEQAYSVYWSEKPELFPSYDDRVKDEYNGPSPWTGNDIPLFEKVPSWCGLRDLVKYFTQKPKVAHTVHWTTATRLLLNDDIYTNVRMLKALQDCGEECEAFNVVASRMMSYRTWGKAANLFGFRVFQDCLQLVSLGFISGMIIMGEGTNVHWQLRLVAILFAVRTLILNGMDMALMLRTFGAKEGVRLLFSFWNIFLVGCEVISAAFIGRVMAVERSAYTGKCSYEDALHSTCEVIKHPVYFSIAIGLKWVVVVLEIMTASGFGNIVLPAFYAVICPDSIWFLSFLAIIITGSFQSYWSLPIPDNLPSPGKSAFWGVFLKVFKLDIMGEADVDGLEGLDEEEVIKRTSDGSFDGSLSGQSESLLYHDAIIILVVVLVTLVAILVMNVAIGVVGEAYNFYKSNANQIWCHYRVNYVSKVLLRRHFWESCFFRSSCCSDDAGSEDYISAEDDRNKGIFIGFHEAWFLDANDTLEALRDILDSEHSMSVQLEKMVNRSEPTSSRAVLSASDSRPLTVRPATRDMEVQTENDQLPERQLPPNKSSAAPSFFGKRR